MTTAFPSDPDRPRGLGSALNGIGAVLVAFWVVGGHLTGSPLAVWVVVVSLIALAAWVVRSFTRRDRVSDVSAVVMLLGGAVTVGPTNGIMVTPAIIAVLAVTIDGRHRMAVGTAFAVVAAAIVSTEAVVDGWSLSALLSVLAGLAIGFVVGFNRRQTRIATERERELLARDLDIEREQQRSTLLADRARVARDIHDVLAHSLGGLVIQLDAVEALLENGRVDEAAARVTAARTLAAEGLGEARRAVATLRDPDSDPTAQRGTLDGADAFDRLLEAHASLAGRTVVEGRAALARLDAAHARAVAGVLREALSNARRHAPGETVTIAASLGERPGLLRLRVSNPVGASAASPAVPDGGGHGLPGMRERIAELGDASSIAVREAPGEFVIDLEVVTA